MTPRQRRAEDRQVREEFADNVAYVVLAAAAVILHSAISGAYS